ncbi:MAG: PAS domain-containing protein [Bacteroidota bacterium]
MLTKSVQENTIQFLPFAVALLDMDFVVLDCSQPLVDLFEVEGTAFLNRKIDRLLGELPRSFQRAQESKKQRSEPLTDYLMNITRKSELRWFKTALYTSSKNDCYYLYVEDVTKKKIALDLALQAERTARIGSWEVDLVNNKLHWSAVTKEIHEVASDFEPDLQSGIEFYKKGKHRDRIIELVSDAIEKGAKYDEELIIVTAKGNEKWVRSIGNSEMINGKCSRLYGVFQDIDLSKREYIKYQELNDRMRIAVESANVGIWDFNIVDNTLIWDENMYALYGIAKNTFSGDYDAWEKTVHPDDKERCVEEVQLAISGQKEFDTEFRILLPDGSEKYIHAQAKVFRDKNDQPVRMIGANTDITRVKQTGRRLRHLLNVTEQQNRSLLNFAHIVSHNLRSNSSNLSMLTGMLLRGGSEENRNRFIDMIRISSERLDETIVQLNEVIKIQTDEGKKMQRIRLASTIQSVMESINGLIAESSAKITIDIPAESEVLAIKPYLTSIFLNLFTNSIKYRNPKRKLSIKIESHHDDDKTVLSFTDNGKGIDLTSYGDKLFGLYKTFHGNEDAKGMGLYISKNQMEAMGGTIAVQSKLDHGTTFKLIFCNQNIYQD